MYYAAVGFNTNRTAILEMLFDELIISKTDVIFCNPFVLKPRKPAVVFDSLPQGKSWIIGRAAKSRSSISEPR